MSNSGTIQSEIEQLGREIFDLIDTEGSGRLPASLEPRISYRRSTEWAMQDPVFKTQMFRFVDVLPTLTSSRGRGETHGGVSEVASRPRLLAFIRGALTLGRLLPPDPRASDPS